MDKHVQFFYDHAGYSYDPMSESPAQGRRKCAERLAAAESNLLDAMRADATLEVQWSDDYFGHDSAGDCEFECCEQASIMRGEQCLASLGGILDADDDYRRVIRAELALECADELLAIAES